MRPNLPDPLALRQQNALVFEQTGGHFLSVLFGNGMVPRGDAVHDVIAERERSVDASTPGGTWAPTWSRRRSHPVTSPTA